MYPPRITFRKTGVVLWVHPSIRTSIIKFNFQDNSSLLFTYSGPVYDSPFILVMLKARFPNFLFPYLGLKIKVIFLSLFPFSSETIEFYLI